MTFDEYNASLQQPQPPDKLSVLLKALWYDAKGDWESAHNLAQDVHSADGSWVHAYLHRKEGDDGNASYWYHRAGRKMPSTSLSDEWRDMVTDLL
jgi:hypothetical protein